MSQLRSGEWGRLVLLALAPLRSEVKRLCPKVRKAGSARRAPSGVVERVFVRSYSLPSSAVEGTEKNRPSGAAATQPVSQFTPPDVMREPGLAAAGFTVSELPN